MHCNYGHICNARCGVTAAAQRATQPAQVACSSPASSAVFLLKQWGIGIFTVFSAGFYCDKKIYTSDYVHCAGFAGGTRNGASAPARMAGGTDATVPPGTLRTLARHYFVVVITPQHILHRSMRGCGMRPFLARPGGRTGDCDARRASILEDVAGLLGMGSAQIAAHDGG